MSSAPELGPDDRLAAELVLLLLEGDELAQALRRQEEDPDFARLVAQWEEHLAPFYDEIREEAPDPRVWDRIAERIASFPEGGATVHQLHRRIRIWRGYAAAATAIAASLALVIGLERSTPPPVPQPQEQPRADRTLVASLAPEGGPASIVLAYDPELRSLIVTPGQIQPAAAHDHELWVIPASGTPRSLGLVAADRPQRIVIPAELTADLGATATLALSVEPEGGSPTGLPTGPVIATGQLQPV